MLVGCFVLVELLEHSLEKAMNIFKLVVFCVIDVEEEGESFLIDLFLVGMVDYIHEVVVQLKFMHFHFPLILDLLHKVCWT